jgi:hypothetical protein
LGNNRHQIAIKVGLGRAATSRAFSGLNVIASEEHTKAFFRQLKDFGEQTTPAIHAAIPLAW